MEIKVYQGFNAIVYQTETTLRDMLTAVGETPSDIMNEIFRQGLNPTGPQIWIYEGCDGQHDKTFKLKIAAPVDKLGTDTEKYQFMEIGEYRCATTIHYGQWQEMGKTYEILMNEMFVNGLQLDGTNRELYLNCDFETPANCVTELAVGIL